MWFKLLVNWCFVSLIFLIWCVRRLWWFCMYVILEVVVVRCGFFCISVFLCGFKWGWCLCSFWSSCSSRRRCGNLGVIGFDISVCWRSCCWCLILFCWVFRVDVVLIVKLLICGVLCERGWCRVCGKGGWVLMNMVVMLFGYS